LRPLFKSVTSFMAVTFQCHQNLIEVVNVISRLFPTNLQRYTFVSCSNKIVQQNTQTIRPFIVVDSLGCEKNGLSLLCLESFVKYKGFETFSERLNQISSTVPFGYVYSLLKPLNMVLFFIFFFIYEKYLSRRVTYSARTFLAHVSRSYFSK
jgi:hypothetical protein